MDDRRVSRRGLIRGASLATAGVVAGALGGSASSAGGSETSKILNCHPQMHYRRLGKTELVISEISLGGHWRAPWRDRSGGWWWGQFANEEVPADVAKNRTEVMTRAIECGMNYLDITGAEECLCYGAALKGRRDRMIVGADDSKLCPRRDEHCNVKAQLFNVEQCLKRLGTDRLDIWRVQMKMDGTNTDADVEVVIEAFEKLKKQGKVLHLGLSSHHRPWTQHVIETYPQIEMFIFPCTARTKRRDEAATPDNIEEVSERRTGPQHASVFASLKAQDVGLIAIKPFFGGSLFENPDRVKLGVGSKQENDLARLTLQCILNLDEAVTAVIPGLSTEYEVDNAVRASYTRPMGASAAERQWLDAMTERQWANVPAEYHWLSDWETV